MVHLLEQDVSAAEDKFNATMDKHGLAKRKLDAVGNRLPITHLQLDAAEHNSVTTDLELLKLATTKLELAAAEFECVATQLNLASTPYQFAIDCLWLLIHFFYPIQQCAQQVYHTAVSLSPTSSPLHGSCLQSVTDNKLSHVAAFSGAPSTWGLLLRTIDFKPKQFTCITTSVHGIISACGNIVGVYGVIPGVLKQSRVPQNQLQSYNSHQMDLFCFLSTLPLPLCGIYRQADTSIPSPSNPRSVMLQFLQLPLHVALLMVLSHSGVSLPKRGLNPFGVETQL